jgi:outer membrane protein W
MKKTSPLLIILLFCTSAALLPKGTVKLGAYAGYFRQADSTFRQIYGEDVIYGLKLGVRVWKNLSIWVSGMQYRKTGRTTLLADITTLTVNPIHLSLRYTFKLGAVNPYLQGGYTYLIYNEESEIGDVNKEEGKGYSADAGIEFKISTHFIVDIGAKYSQVNVKPTTVEADLGGMQAGVSLLVVF